MPDTNENHPDWRRRAAERLDGDERARLEALWDELEPPPVEPPRADLVRATMERVRSEARREEQTRRVAPWHAMGWRPSLAGAALAAALCVGLALGLLAGTTGMDGAEREAVLAETESEADLSTDADLFGSPSAGLAEAWWNAWGGGDDVVEDALSEPDADVPAPIPITRGRGEGGA